MILEHKRGSWFKKQSMGIGINIDLINKCISIGLPAVTNVPH